MMVWCVVMTISLNLNDTVEWMPILSIISVIGFIIGFAVGPGKLCQNILNFMSTIKYLGPVPWLLTTELFRQSSRPGAFAISCVANWTSNFLLALMFPFMQVFIL